MSHKITILNIEHIDWAKRIIIYFNINQSVVAPNVGSWVIKQEGCGYKNVCDSEWIIMYPNTQHPLHSNTIKTAGNYQFVWDYGGEYGLDPSDFDAEHSYVVQLAYIDSSCGWRDPCSDREYLTQFGEEPAGEIGSTGDELFTNNNCGPGFILLADAQGCLYCDPIVSGPTEPSGEETGPSEGSGGTLPSSPSGPGGLGGTGGETGPGKIEQNGPWGFSDKIIFHEIQSLNPIGTPYGPATINQNIASDPEPPFNSSDTVRGIAGMPLNPLMVNNYSYLNVLSMEDGTSYRFDKPFVATVYGGKSPSINVQSNSINAIIHPIFKTVITNRDDELDVESRIDQLNISTSNVKHNILDKPNIDIKSTTKLKNSIEIVDNKIFLNFNENSKSTLNILSARPQKNIRPSQVSIINGEGDLLDTNSSDNALYSLENAKVARLSSISASFNTSGSRNFNETFAKILSGMNTFQISSDFTSNFTLDFITVQTIRSGENLFMDLVLRNKNNNIYRLRASIYVVYQGGRKLILQTDLKDRRNPLVIEENIPINLPSGETKLVALIDDGTKIISFASKKVSILDPGTTKRGGIPGDGNVNFLQEVEQTLELSSYLTFPLGPPNNAVGILTEINNSAQDVFVKYSALVQGTKTIRHALKIYDANMLVVNSSGQSPIASSVGQLNIKGINPEGRYSTAIFSNIRKTTLSLGQSAKLLLIVSNTDSSISNTVDLYLGKEIKFISPYIVSQVYNYSNSSVALSLYLPYPSLGGINQSFVVYHAGGNNLVPLNVTTYGFTTDTNGAANVSLPCPRGSYVGVAFANPVNVSLFNRTISWLRID